MHISPINNINFNGQFQKSKVLVDLLTVSDKETLGRFNEVLERAAKVNDRCTYRIAYEEINNPLSYTEILKFFLNKEDLRNKFECCEQIAVRFVDSYVKPQQKLENCSSVLKEFLPKLEKQYPKRDYDEPNSTLIQKIINKLA